MRPSRLRDSFGIDGFLLVAASILLVVSLFFLFYDGTLTTERSPQSQTLVAVGKIANSHNDVRRKVEEGFSWSNIKDKDVVYEGDSIFTGDESDAQIELKSGGKIQIDPKSLVVVRTQGKNLSLDLQYGSLVGKVDSGASIMINQNGELKELTANGAEIRIESAGQGKDTSIQVVSGEIKLRSAGGDPSKTQVIKQNEIAQLNSQGGSEIKKVEIQLLAPPSGAILWLEPGKTLDFEWTTSGKADTELTRLEFSRDLDFAKPLYAVETRDKRYSVPEASRPQGSFNWRIQPVANTADAATPSISSRLTVYPDVAPSAVLPSDGQEFAFDVEKGEKGAQITLSWDDKAGSEDYHLVVARDESFKEIVHDKKTGSLTDRTAPLPKGSYFWRVQGLHKARKNAPWSPVAKFSVYENFDSMPAPVMRQAEIKYEIPEQILARVPASVAASGRGVQPDSIAPFEWEAVANAESYEVEVSSNQAFDNPVKIVTGSETKFAPSEVKPGAMFVRVRARGPRGIVSEPSESARLSTSLPAPTMDTVQEVVQKFNTKEELEKGKYDFVLNWTPRPYADSYELEWGSDPSFNRTKKFIVKEPTRSIGVSKPWEYSARVRALASDGTPISEFSAAKVASYKKELLPPPVPTPAVPVLPEPVEPEPILEAPAVKTVGVPKPQEPRKDTSIVSLKDSIPFVNFKWKDIPDAVHYEVQIAEDAEFKKLIDTVKVKTSRLLLQKQLPEGRVYWRVRTHNAKKEYGEWSATYHVNVFYQ